MFSNVNPCIFCSIALQSIFGNGLHQVLDDPSGNGFIENLHAPLADPQITCEQYTRTSEQNKLLGFVDDDATVGEENEDDDKVCL